MEIQKHLRLSSCMLLLPSQCQHSLGELPVEHINKTSANMAAGIFCNIPRNSEIKRDKVHCQTYTVYILYYVYFLLYLHMSLQLLQQRGVFVEPHEGLTEAGGQSQDPRSAGSLALHELV